ncbi:DNRLRE domain-containing protein [Bifidobacterium psychraerophilum]|uniref:DNRLRE domain-containing protein n=1 Tax=Bifidobacterium psychraerophilum TaxID=218140 RepID=UPI0039EAC15A
MTEVSAKTSGIAHIQPTGIDTGTVTTSNLNFAAGVNESNTAIVRLGSDGKIQVEASTVTDMLVDVQGYYTSGNTAAGGMVPITSQRIADTRYGTGINKAKLTSGSTTTIQVTGKAGVPSGASAVFVNLTIPDSTCSTSSSGYLTAYPADQSKTNASLNYAHGRADAISATVQLSPGGAFKIYSADCGSIDLIVDVQAYYLAGSSNGMLTPTSTRVMDTRKAPHVAVKPNQAITVPVGGSNGLPGVGDGLTAIAINIIIIDHQAGGGNLSVWADGTKEPSNSMMNFNNNTTSNLVMTAVGVDGAVQMRNNGADVVDIVVDAQGWFASQNSTLCQNETVSLLKPESAGANDADPVVSAIAVNSLGLPVTGEIHVQDADGHEVGETPTAVGTVESGTRLTYQIPVESLTSGQTYTWWVHAATNDVCDAQSTSTKQTFTMGSVPVINTTEPSNSIKAELSVSSAPTGSGACNGKACTFTGNDARVGSDTSNETWMSYIQANMSAIPAGSTVTSAVLHLAQSSCLKESKCGNGEIVVSSPSDEPVAATGADLAASDLVEQASATLSDDTADIDVTSTVAGWISGFNSNTGLAISYLNDDGSAATGAQMSTPDSSVNPLSLTVQYELPRLPSAPTKLRVTKGDGGLVASWLTPDSTGYAPGIKSTTGLTGYTINVDNGAKRVASTIVTGNTGIVTGLENDIAYSVTVTANNPLGEGPSSEPVTVVPVTVKNGSVAYTMAVSQLLNAHVSLISGTSGSQADATHNDSQIDSITNQLGKTAASDVNIALDGLSDGQQATQDTVTLDKSLASKNSDGSVTVYAASHETYTTRDESDGTTVPAGASDWTAYTFDTSGTTPLITETIDASSLLMPLSPEDMDTAQPPSLANATSEDDQNGDASANDKDAVADTAGTGILGQKEFSVRSAALATTGKPTKHFVANNSQLKAIVKYAHANVHAAELFAPDDCTNFVSNALFSARFHNQISGTSARVKSLLPGHHNDINSWYIYYYQSGLHIRQWSWSSSWSSAHANWQWQVIQDAPRSTHPADAKAGDIIYANWNGNKTSGIGHAGIVTVKGPGNHLYITQHSAQRENEPLYRADQTKTKQRSWQGSKPHLSIWIVQPSQNK